MQTAPSLQDTEEFMPDFNKKTAYLQYCLNKIKENNTSIEKLKEGHMKSTLTDQEKGFYNDIALLYYLAICIDRDRLIDENAKLCTSVKTDLEKLDAEVARAKEKEPVKIL